MGLKLIFILAIVPSLSGQTDKKEPDKKEYVGSAMCSACHEDIATGFQKSPHQTVELFGKQGFKEKACESCHGPASKHAESADPNEIRNPLKVSALESNKTCLQCHMNQPTRVGSIRGGHARNQVACTSCHSIHKAKAKKNVTNCGTCHVAQLAQFNKPFRHKLQEGGVDCVDCHNPHGRQLANPVRENSANEPGCNRCHGDKRGPFTFEHAPVKTEGCQSCHDAHGSNNPKMLARPEVRQLCLECHANFGGANTATVGGLPPAFHDLRNPRIRNCTVCHVKVHGSHVNRALLR